jgi:hypothetical protein
MIPALLALALGAAPQQGAEAARARLEELIASTNDLPGFRAEYVLRRGEEELGRIELVYRAPDRLVMSNRSDKGWARVGLDGERLWMDSESGAAGALAGAFELDDHGGPFEEAMAVLERAFPRPPEQVDVGVRLSWGVNAETDKTEFDLQIAWVRTGEERLLGWLHTLRTLEGGLSLEGDALVHVSPRVRAEVDAQSGFLRRLHMVGAEGEARELALESLDVQGPLADELFARPSPAEGARDVSAQLREQMFKPAALRSESLLHIDALLREGRAFDERARADLRLFLEALHRPVLQANVARWRAGVLEGIAEFSAEIAQRRQAGDAEADLRAVIDERRAQLVTSVDETLAKLRASLETATRNPRPSQHWVEVRSIEDEVLGKMYGTEVAEPLLAAFDEGT